MTDIAINECVVLRDDEPFCTTCNLDACNHVMLALANGEDVFANGAHLPLPENSVGIALPLGIALSLSGYGRFRPVFDLSEPDENGMRHYGLHTRSWKNAPPYPLDGFLSQNEGRWALIQAFADWLDSIYDERPECASVAHSLGLDEAMQNLGRHHQDSVHNTYNLFVHGLCIKCDSLVPDVTAEFLPAARTWKVAGGQSVQPGRIVVTEFYS